MPTYIVLLGPPGAGKGTQAQIISDKLGLPHISSGDIFRENLKTQTPLGVQAKGYIDRGELVPDDLTIAMVQERLQRSDCLKGALLDGFPRTPAQAEALAVMLTGLDGKVDLTVYIHVPEAVLIERLTGRWTCRAQAHIYHEKYNPPRQPGVCDQDGSALYQREDDKAETVTNRIRVYLKQTMPLIAFYREGGKLVEVDGTQAIEQVTAELLSILPAAA
ncbi:MAG: adenylate kinase [Chloroflexi bacterium]|nr:adenylate kinase [Chloroflexota bacterium]